jgi:hypothetical protein
VHTQKYRFRFIGIPENCPSRATIPLMVSINGDRPAVVVVPLVMLGGGEVPPQPGTKTTPPPDSVKHSLQAPRGTKQLISPHKFFKGLGHEIEFKYRGKIYSFRYKQEPSSTDLKMLLSYSVKHSLQAPTWHRSADLFV